MSSTFMGSIVGGGVAGAIGSGMAAVMYGGNLGDALLKGAVSGAIAGRLTNAFTNWGIPDAFAASMGSYITGYWAGGRKNAEHSAKYAFSGSLMGASLTMMGVDADGEVSSMTDQELKQHQEKNDVFVVTPSVNFDPWMFLGLFSGGYEHTWHANDGRLHLDNGHHRYYQKVDTNRPWPGSTPFKGDYRLFSNNCTTRLGPISPSAYRSLNMYVPAIYWMGQNN